MAILIADLHIPDNYTNNLEKFTSFNNSNVDCDNSLNEHTVTHTVSAATFYSRKIRTDMPSIKAKVDLVKNVNWKKQHQTRAGIIPYTRTSVGISFCLGRDTFYNSYTDFGGGVKISDKTPLHAAFREFDEETYGSFNFYPNNLLKNTSVLNSIVIYNADMLILFLEIDYDADKVNKIYAKNMSLVRRNETNQLLHLTKDEFIYSVRFNDPWMFFPIRDFIGVCLDKLIRKLTTTKTISIDVPKSNSETNLIEYEMFHKFLSPLHMYKKNVEYAVSF